MINTDKLRNAVPNFREAVARGGMDTYVENVVVVLCNEIDKLREESAALRDWVTRLENLYRSERSAMLGNLCTATGVTRLGDKEWLLFKKRCDEYAERMLEAEAEKTMNFTPPR